MADLDVITDVIPARYWGKGRDPHRRCRADADVEPRLRLVYDPADPLVVTVAGWPFLREHLEVALQGGCGDTPGVTHVHRESNELVFWMRGEDGEATVWLPQPAVEAFADRTELLVPFGSELEFVDWGALTRGWAA